MPRANRHHIPGQVWHITHRCHKREFLFRFAKDRTCWLQWLHEAKKRYNLCILNYMVTSNHIHLLVVDDESDVISSSIQLIAGRTAQAFNRRKGRKGAYWEDRYHATAIESGSHLLRCLVYMDMNMVRAGVVSHPSEWQHCGYHEIQSPPQRYRLIDRSRLIELTEMAGDEPLRLSHREWVEQSLGESVDQRRPEWTKAVAVGSEMFVSQIKQKMGIDLRGRMVGQVNDAHILREPESSYSVHLGREKVALSHENTVYFDENAEESIC